VGQKYDPHHDFFYDQINARPEHGGQRIATVLMYLCAPFSSLVPDLPQRMLERRQVVAPAPLMRLLDKLLCSTMCAA